MENIRILLVDDEADFRSAIARRLNKRGISAEQAGSGEECLNILKNITPDVIVSDVKMPGMNGLELLRLIRQDYPNTEVILLTGHASPHDGVEGIKSGAFDYLTKPLEFEQLVSKITQAYEKIQRREEKKREAILRDKMEQQMIITERLASLGTLATGVAHEINNPLAIIKESAGWMQLILKKEELAQMPRKADFEKALGKIESGVERARRITHQLLGFVQKNDSVLSEVNLKQLLEESVELVKREAADKDIEIRTDFSPAVKNIWSDPYQLRQVFINLINNAIHATPKQGKITLKLDAAGKDVFIQVKDTGEGIPKENMMRIFEPFFSTKSPGKGTGLGLFVTRGIIDKLGGKIELESQVGQGTVFSITLPQYHELEEESEESKQKRFKLFDTILKK
ncbi:MAG: hybrid sensor histidine kinase/response regulator [Desulfobacteraceae bacterium IS3]|nr:MAG: hybrid sensor histidine kinase/response regulator [Desulfobacteraceae bacterium IS3]